MLFLSLSPLTSNIARRDICLWVILGQKCLFSQNNSERAYLPHLKRIKACNSQYVEDCGAWRDSYYVDTKTKQ